MSSVNIRSAEASGNAVQVNGNVTGNVNFYSSPHDCLGLLKADWDYAWLKDRNPDRTPDTGNWVLKHGSYLSWLRASSGPLLVSADPGCGKSVLSRFLVDSRFDGQITDKTSICYFFFKDDSQNQLIDALCVLLHQLFRQQPWLQEKHLNSRAVQSGNPRANVSTLWNILETAVQDPAAEAVILVLDALDECPQNGQNMGRLGSMIEIHFKAMSQSGRLKIFMTSRPYNKTMMHIDRLERSTPNIRIRGEDEDESIRKEIDLVIADRVDRLYQFSDDARVDLKARMLAMPHRTYLWCALVFEYLETERNIRRTKRSLLQAVETLPRNVNEAYEKILARSSNPSLTRRALLIVFAAIRPLNLTEMQIAFDGTLDGFEPLAHSASRVPIANLDLESDQDFKHRIRDLCGFFLVIYEGHVSFLHQTAKDFLHDVFEVESIPTSWTPGAKWGRSLRMCDGHAILAKTCIAYLGNVGLKDKSASRGLVSYAKDNWAAHYRRTWDRTRKSLVPFVLSIIDPDSPNLSVWLPRRGSYKPSESIVSNMIESACALGLVDIVSILVDLSHLIEQDQIQLIKDSGWYSLMDEARYLKQEPGQHIDATLTKFEVDRRIDAASMALMHAARHVKLPIIKMLFDHSNLDVNRKDNENCTAFQRAYGVNCNIHCVWMAGDPRVVQLFLDNPRVDFDTKDARGRTILSHAAERGDESTLQALLATGKVDVNSQDHEGRTPLAWACRSSGQKSMVERLLNVTETLPDMRDMRGSTPLHEAVIQGFLPAVQLLLKSSKVDPDTKNARGRSPLIIAVQGRHIAIVKELLHTHRVNVDWTDRSGQSARSWARKHFQSKDWVSHELAAIPGPLFQCDILLRMLYQGY